MNYTKFDGILEGYEATEENALDYARGMAWCEVEISECDITYGRYIDTVAGIEVYYDYGADYYFFCPVDEE